MIDRDRMTSGGVTAGIDIALSIVAEVAGRDAASSTIVRRHFMPVIRASRGPRSSRRHVRESPRAMLSAKHDWHA